MKHLNSGQRKLVMAGVIGLTAAVLHAAGVDFARGEDGKHYGSPTSSISDLASGGGCRTSKETDEEEFQTRLFVAESDGAKMKPLTDLSDYQAQGSPCWSRDSKFIAFDAWKPQEGEGLSESKIIVVNADGSRPRVVGPGAMPCFSPVGHRIAFSRPKAGGVWVMSSDRPDDELFLIDAQGWGADWSPDGKLAYAVHAAGKANLAVKDFVEGRVDLLFDKQKSPYRRIFWNMAWSPDGKASL